MERFTNSSNSHKLNPSNICFRAGFLQILLPVKPKWFLSNWYHHRKNVWLSGGSQCSSHSSSICGLLMNKARLVQGQAVLLSQDRFELLSLFFQNVEFQQNCKLTE